MEKTLSKQLSTSALVSDVFYFEEPKFETSKLTSSKGVTTVKVSAVKADAMLTEVAGKDSIEYLKENKVPLNTGEGAAKIYVNGTQNDDWIVGTNTQDQLFGNDGNDIILGLGGNDLLVGGNGNDIIVTGSVVGNTSIVFAGADNDIVIGGVGFDVIFGQDGDDIMLGLDGTDYLLGGSGNDIILGGNGNDILQGGTGNDTIDGGNGIDTLDISDMQFGGAFGNPICTLYFPFSTVGATYNTYTNLATGEFIVYENGVAVQSDVILSIESFNGSVNGVDYVVGDSNDNIITLANDGVYDFVSSGDGNDTIYNASNTNTGNGDDTVYATAFGHHGLGSGNDVFYGYVGTDIVYGDFTVVGDTATGNDIIFGFGGNDFLYGDNGDDLIDGGTGNDTIHGGNGLNTLTGGANADIFIFDITNYWGNYTGFTDTVTDFQIGIDKIDTNGVSYIQLTNTNSITYVGSDTHISYNNGLMIVENALLTQSDVI